MGIVAPWSHAESVGECIDFGREPYVDETSSN